VVLVLIPFAPVRRQTWRRRFLPDHDRRSFLPFHRVVERDLPVSIRAAEQRLGISNQVANLCADGRPQQEQRRGYKAVTAVFLTHLYGLDLDAGRILTIL
jgi:hypothetical protein